jgi:hypothetical protein
MNRTTHVWIALLCIALSILLFVNAFEYALHYDMRRQPVGYRLALLHVAQFFAYGILGGTATLLNLDDSDHALSQFICFYGIPALYGLLMYGAIASCLILHRRAREARK